jgi:hypothetical protein
MWMCFSYWPNYFVVCRDCNWDTDH